MSHRITSDLISVVAALGSLLLGLAVCSAQSTESEDATIPALSIPDSQPVAAETAGRATFDSESAIAPSSAEDSTPELNFEASDPQQIFSNSQPSESTSTVIELSEGEAGDHLRIPSADDGVASYVLSTWHSEPYRNYRSSASGWTWLPGSGQDFGWLSWQGTPYTNHGTKGGLTTAIGIHMLGGPVTVPIPPRLFDFVLGYQHRGSLSEEFSYDLATSVGVYSDFEGSAREGVRFPSHAVGMLHLDHSRDFVFGVDYLDRDDIAILPVIGMSFHELSISELRLDLVFPRPKISYLFDEHHTAYIAAYLDGGTWDIEEPGGVPNVMTYRDYRLVLGFETDLGADSLSVWEFGYVFGRELEMRSGYPDTDLSDAFMLRIVYSH